MKKKSKEKEYILDEYYDFQRKKGYSPFEYITVEDEIRDICRKNRIIVQRIVPYDGYKVFGKIVRSNKECGELQEILDKQNNTNMDIQILTKLTPKDLQELYDKLGEIINKKP